MSLTVVWLPNFAYASMLSTESLSVMGSFGPSLLITPDGLMYIIPLCDTYPINGNSVYIDSGDGSVLLEYSFISYFFSGSSLELILVIASPQEADVNQ